MENLVIVDPAIDYPHDMKFDDVNYFHGLSLTAGPGKNCYMIWTDETVQIEGTGWFIDEDGNEYGAPVVDTKTKIKGMIELQVNPNDQNEIWLMFFEVTKDYKGQGFSKVMIKGFIDEFKKHFPGKILSRSTPSREGMIRLKDNFSKALDESGIKYKLPV